MLHRSAAASVMGMVKDDPVFLQRCLTNSSSQQAHQRPSALCIGIGGGSMPLFLSHHFPGMLVEAVDLDPAVLAAASHAMGFPLDRCNAATCHRITHALNLENTNAVHLASSKHVIWELRRRKDVKSSSNEATLPSQNDGKSVL